MKKNLWILQQIKSRIVSFLLKLFLGKEGIMLIYAYATAVISGSIKWSKIVSVFTPRIQEAIKEKMLELLDDQALVDELTTTKESQPKNNEVVETRQKPSKLPLQVDVNLPAIKKKNALAPAE